jgi:hypothetical protein
LRRTEGSQATHQPHKGFLMPPKALEITADRRLLYLTSQINPKKAFFPLIRHYIYEKIIPMSRNLAHFNLISPNLKLPKGGMEAACYQFSSFCEVKTASLKTAWMRFLSTVRREKIATGE